MSFLINAGPINLNIFNKNELKKILIYFFLFGICFWALSPVHAQDTAVKKHNHNIINNEDSTGHTPKKGIRNVNIGEHKKLEYFRDTVRRKRRKFDSTLFTNISVPTTSDYAEELGKVYLMLSKIPGVTGSFVKLHEIHEYLDKGDSALDILKEKMSQNERSFSVRNLQMFNTLLDALDNTTQDYSGELDDYDTTLDVVREQITDLQKDTLMLQIFRDTSLSEAFRPQLRQLKSKWAEVDSLVTEKGKEINTLRSQASAHSITIGELLSMVDMELKSVGSKALGKERRYLWEPSSSESDYSQDDFNESIRSEEQLAALYFSNNRGKRVWLLLFGVIFFYWVWWNLRSLRKLAKIDVIKDFHFTYIDPYPIGGSLIVMLSIAPLFDLMAPAIYLESVQLLSIIILTFIFVRRINRVLFYGWCVFVFLFLLLLVIRIMGLPQNSHRWANLIVDGTAFAFGLYFLFSQKKKCGRWVFFSICLYLWLNLLAVICNLFGRVTLSQIFGYTAAYSVAQFACLGVFVKLVQESFLLQIQTSRTRKKYPKEFDFSAISNSILNFSITLAIVLWLIVFTSNLNLFDALNDFLVDLFTTNRQVGNFNFTFGGIVLFFGIIWLANFLQKYIAYFFGDTGDDASVDDKGQRSRLMVTRLILLISGFLLAVAASGLAVDRITVILGALGVGIGLGLQSIVNNFVSGVILIFDRPLRIGDTVDIGDKRGRVKEIGIRTSTLLTEDGAEVIIPNGDVLSHNIINWTLSNNYVRETFSFNIDKPNNLEDIGVDDIKSILKKNPNVMEQREPEILFNTINTKTIEVKIFFWCKDFNKSAFTTGEVRGDIYKLMEKKGIIVQ